MNKTDLVNAIAATGLSKADSKQALDAVIDAISGALKEGDKVAILGFGTFAVTERPARTGINPATKEKIQIEAKKVIKFKPGAELAGVVKYSFFDSPLVPRSSSPGSGAFSCPETAPGRHTQAAHRTAQCDTRMTHTRNTYQTL